MLALARRTAVLGVLIAPLCHGAEADRAAVEEPTQADLKNAWMRDVVADLEKGSKITPGKYYVFDDKVVLYPYDSTGKVSPKSIQIPTDWIAYKPDAATPWTNIAVDPAIPKFIPGGGGSFVADRRAHDTIAEQTKTIVELAKTIGEMKSSLDHLRKEVESTGTRVKALEAKQGDGR